MKYIHGVVLICLMLISYQAFTKHHFTTRRLTRCNRVKNHSQVNKLTAKFTQSTSQLIEHKHHNTYVHKQTRRPHRHRRGDKRTCPSASLR